MSSRTTKSPSQPSRMRRGTLSQETIVEAAIELIDREGLAAFSIRGLATRLGARPMSLYTHFRDRDALLRAVYEDLLSRVSWPESSDDVEWLREMMRAYFQLLTAHPAIVQIDTGPDGSDATEARMSEEIYARLLNLGIDHRRAVGLVATLMRFVLGCAMLYPVRRAWDEDPEHWERVRRRLAGLPAEAYPAMHTLTADFPVFSQRDVFEFGLDVILAPVYERR